MSLKDLVRNYAYEIGADLVGFGDIGRCKHAPPMMSPQGLYPKAKGVIVMALHHPDACIELGGENHPQDIGPYTVQYLMNTRLDFMSYQMATFLERHGCGAVPIASSNIWRYNEYKDLKAVFAPDVSHIYMAVVAGLADMGYNGLAITPEYGARNRFITIITDAEFESDPLIPPGTICDGCMLCRKHCPSQALSKEINGDKVLKIGPYEYRFANKNLWRCAWGEHFDLDVNLEIPEVVTEQVILENVARHGFRGGEMGQCVKFCVPKNLRTFDKSYSRTPMRKYGVSIDESTESRAVADRLFADLMAAGADEVIVSSTEQLRQSGIDIDAILPGACSAVTIGLTIPPAADNAGTISGARDHINFICYDLTRKLEALGHRSLMTIKAARFVEGDPHDANPTDAIIGSLAADLSGKTIYANTVITRKTLPPQRRSSSIAAGVRSRLDHGDASHDLTAHLRQMARSFGADLVGIAPVSRFDELAPQLRPLMEVETLTASDKSPRFTPWQPQIEPQKHEVKTPADYLPGARSVIVLALRYHKEVLRWATKPPAEAVGPYAFQTYVTNWVGLRLGLQVIKQLEQFGHTATLTMDLMNTTSRTASPRGPQHDLPANRFAGLAAGLGYMTAAGYLATNEFGLRQRLIAVVTDAELTPSPLMAAPQDLRCDSCDKRCINSCPSKAITAQSVTVTCEGHSWSFNLTDRARCDWVKRYALMGDGGYRFLGSTVDIAPPEQITAEALDAALRELDPIKKYRPIAAEPCVLNCPLAF